MLELTLKKSNISVPDSWWQLYLNVYNTEVRIGNASYYKEDCIKEAENLVKEFSKEGIFVVHSKIYEV